MENIEINYDEIYKPHYRQKLAHAAKERYVLYGGSMGGGKASEINSLVYTPYGPKKMADIEIGDKVCNLQGKNSKVIAIYPQGKKDIYEFIFTDGSKTKVTEDHAWVYKIGQHGICKKFNLCWKIGLTKHMIEYLKNDKNIQVPNVKPVQFTKSYEHNFRKIHPYLLGVLIGDGHLSEQNLTISSNDHEIIDKCSKVSNMEWTKSLNYGFVYKSSGDKLKELKYWLNKNNLLNKLAYDKFIPEHYKYWTIENRFELLQGLMDTDGYCSQNGKAYFCSVSKQLALDVQWLVRSLGGNASIFEKPGRYRDKDGNIVECKLAYNVYIRMPNNKDIFYLPRKKNLAKKYNGGLGESGKTIESIEYVGKEEAKCIKIDHPNGLYITDDFIVTHNSVFLVNEAIMLSLDYPGNRGLLCRWESAAFKRTTYKALMDYLPPQIIKAHRQNDQLIILKNGSEIMYGGLKPSGGSNPIDRIKSMDLGWFGIDEASEAPREFFDVLCSRINRGLIEKNQEKFKKLYPNAKIKSPVYKGLLTTNPEPGWVRSAFVDRKDDDCIFIPALPADNPYLPKSYIEDLKKRFSDEWIERYLNGDWTVLDTGNRVFPYKYILNAININLEPNKKDSVYGLDVGEGGTNSDSSVLYHRYGGVCRMIWEDQISDEMQIVGKTLTSMDDMGEGDSIVNVDSIGIGSGVASRLMESPNNKNVNRVIGGESADELDDNGNRLFANKRTELYWNARTKFEKGLVDIEDDEELKAELSCITYSVDSEKVISIESKKELRKRGIKSPNKMDALVYCLADSESELGIDWI